MMVVLVNRAHQGNFRLETRILLYHIEINAFAFSVPQVVLGKVVQQMLNARGRVNQGVLEVVVAIQQTNVKDHV